MKSEQKQLQQFNVIYLGGNDGEETGAPYIGIPDERGFVLYGNITKVNRDDDNRFPINTPRTYPPNITS